MTTRSSLDPAENGQMTRRRSTYGMPGGSGADDFRGKQLPAFEPVDDLSRFVLDRIREAETEPVADQVEPNGHPMGYRYAKHVRRDMVAFRRIVAAHLTMLEAAADAAEKGEDREMQRVLAGMVAGSLAGVQVIANRWDDHHEFQESWRLP